MDRLKLSLEVTDPEVVAELGRHEEGPERDAHAAVALRLGVLALRQARGELDARTVREEGTRLVTEVHAVLAEHGRRVATEVAGALREYLHPETGVLPQRLERLVRQEGELDRLLARHLGDEGALARTLAHHVGEHSPLFRLLSPSEATGVLRALEGVIAEVLDAQRRRLGEELSLDHPDSALSRLVRAMTDSHGRLREEFARNVDAVTTQLSLDRPDSALSRLVSEVSEAQRGIAREFSLDDERSSLSRLQRSLAAQIERLQADQRDFQVAVREAVAALQARRAEALRSTRHGGAFEDAVCEVLGREAQRLGDVATPCGATVGRIRNSKVGDLMVELGPDSAAPAERVVVEAKAAAGYDLRRAREELTVARENRDAQVGIFVFARAVAPAGLEVLGRYGPDVVTVWDAEDPTTDVYLRTAYSLARALVVARARGAAQLQADFAVIDVAVAEINRRAESLDEIGTASQTITGASERIGQRARLAKEGLLREVERLREHLDALRRAAS